MNNKITQIPEAIRQETLRCLYCVDAPCKTGCPAGVDVAQFIRCLRGGDLKSAKREIKDANPLGGVCGYLCPSVALCQSKCTRAGWDEAVKIRELQRYVCDHAAYTLPTAPAVGKKVAVVGAGPAGLGCAAALARRGVDVTVYEKRQTAGGIVDSEIPESRIATEAAQKDVAELLGEHITIRYNEKVDAEKLAGLQQQYDAVFLGIGLAKDREVGLCKPDGGKMSTASQFLTALKNGSCPRVEGTVIVIGGGDSAVDAAEAALRHGADRAVLTYRRSRREMPATDETLVDAMSEGMEILYNTSLIGIEPRPDGRLTLRYVHNRLVEPEDGGRRSFEAVAGSEYTQIADRVVFALGKTADASLTAGLRLPDADTGRLGDSNVFAGGDFVNGGQTVVEAVQMGKHAADGIAGLLGLL